MVVVLGVNSKCTLQRALDLFGGVILCSELMGRPRDQRLERVSILNSCDAEFVVMQLGLDRVSQGSTSRLF